MSAMTPSPALQNKLIGTINRNMPETAGPDVVERIALVIPSLAGGGSERVVAGLANAWADHGRQVLVVTLDRADRDAYRLDPRIRRVPLELMTESGGLLSAVRNNVRRVSRLRRVVQQERPDVLVSFIDRTNVLALLACTGLPVDVVVSERVDPTHYDIGRTWSLLRRWTYPRCGALVVQTEGIRDRFREIVRGRPISVIPNSVGTPGRETTGRAYSESVGFRNRPQRMIAMGRLVPQKGFDLLIDAFSRIAGKHPDWTLEILGEGPLRAELEGLIRQKGCPERIILRGWTDHPETVLQQSQVFVLASRFEGFPNALMEAMACGLCSVSFDCGSGPAEILRDGVDGILVPPEDVGALAAALDHVLSNGEERERLGTNAVDVTQRFGIEPILQRWEAVLQTCRAHRP